MGSDCLTPDLTPEGNGWFHGISVGWSTHSARRHAQLDRSVTLSGRRPWIWKEDIRPVRRIHESNLSNSRLEKTMSYSNRKDLQVRIQNLI